MNARLDFATDGANWPHRAASRFITVDGTPLHVQVMGDGPALLLLHGTGAATHSWRGLMPLLAERFTCIALDLPGHGFSGDPGQSGLSLTGMARAVRGVLDALALEPIFAVGHSAGAALAIRMALDGQLKLAGIISLNGALMPFGGALSQLFAPIARVVATMPLMTGLFAWRSRDPRVLDDMIKQTGSRLDAEGRAHYQTLAGNAEHVSAAFGMMANWDLTTLERDMPRLAVPLHLVAAQRDAMVKPRISEEAAALIPGAQLIYLPGLGHLAHEEQPEQVAALISDIIAGRPAAQAANTNSAATNTASRKARTPSKPTQPHTKHGRPA
jgi:magnesium chelatase accessory protein